MIVTTVLKLIDFQLPKPNQTAQTLPLGLRSSINTWLLLPVNSTTISCYVQSHLYLLSSKWTWCRHEIHKHIISLHLWECIKLLLPRTIR